MRGERSSNNNNNTNGDGHPNPQASSRPPAPIDSVGKLPAPPEGYQLFGTTSDSGLLGEQEATVAPLTSASQLVTQQPALSPHAAFGITVIVGGTNVRFSLSVPGRQDTVIKSFTWMELKDCLSEQLAQKGIEFEHATEDAIAEIARRLIEFVEEQSPKGQPPPFDKVCIFNFSVAGAVEGQGCDALVTTSNTGVNLKGEPLARGIIGTIQQELSNRSLPPMPTDQVYVLNDAVAGAYGEYQLGALKGVDTGVFVIIGTGVGGVTLQHGQPNPSFSEFGYTIISHTLDGARRYIVKDGSKLLDELDQAGNFPNLPTGQSYIQNHLAGPWFAINFVRKYNQQLAEPEPDWKMLQALASKISPWFPTATKDELTNQLLELSELDWKKRQSWAISSSSILIKAINSFLLLPDGEAVLDAVPCTGTTDEWRRKENPELVLTYDAYRYWKSYFKDIGMVVGALSKQMKAQGLPPGKIVLGGGIAETCASRLSESMKTRALELIHRYSRLAAGSVVFSTMAPEARESALATQVVQESNQNNQTEDTSSGYTIH